MKLYKLVLDEVQLEAILGSLESYVRLGIGQFENILIDLGFHQFDRFSDKMLNIHSDEVKEAIKLIKLKVFDLGPDECLTIGSKKVEEEFKICWDVLQSIRNELQPDTEFKLEPLAYSKCGLIEIEVINKSKDNKIEA